MRQNRKALNCGRLAPCGRPSPEPNATQEPQRDGSAAAARVDQRFLSVFAAQFLSSQGWKVTWDDGLKSGSDLETQ